MPSPSEFGFFLDVSGQWTKTIGTGVIIANERQSFGTAVNNDSRIFGFSAAFEDGDTSAMQNWNLLEGNKTKIKSSATDQVKAQNILLSVLVKGKDDKTTLGVFPYSTAPDPTKGEQWFYAQNFQVEGGTMNANEIYAQVAAITWAFKKLYPNISSIPTFDSYFVKSNEDPFSIETINEKLATLGLQINPITESPPGKNWNFISTLYANGLIDGFIADNFTDPGKIVDSLPFSQNNIPYAMDSKYPNFTKEDNMVSNYYGFGNPMPLQASIYFDSNVDVPNTGKTPNGYFPDFTTKEVPLGSNNTVGTVGNDTITGTSSSDNIHGLLGDDKIIAGKGNDQINGNAGNDYLAGGLGDDRSWGGAGKDTFHLSLGSDIIYDFSIIDGDQIFSSRRNPLSFQQAGNDLIISDGNELNTTLKNVSLQAFNQSDSIL